jgi:ABC-type branched-subunit amino acid transport system permease subunit
MDKRTTGIVATVAAVVLCGCPGLFSLCWGALAAFVSFVPGANIDIGGSNDPRSALVSGIGALCVGVLFIAIPFVVGYFTLRRRGTEVIDVNEPVPPAL